jgi:cytochrome c-type biogenesis protein CcmH
MDQVWFWVAAGGMTLAVAASLVLALWRPRGAEPAAAYDLRVYRDQLREIERDLARGTVQPEEAERLRTEVARRALAADRALAAAAPDRTPGTARLVAVVLIALAVGAGTVWAYLRIGAPGYPDIPLAARLAEADARLAARIGQDEAEARFAATRPAPADPDPQHADLMVQLRAALAERPGDLRGHELLARNEALIGDFAAARRAQERVIALKGDAATAEDHAALAELMIMAAGGFVSPEAEAALKRALDADPRNPTAFYYMGLMFAQNGRFDLAFRVWRPLLEASAPDAPWVEPIRAQIGEVAALAGVPYTPPERPRGPTAEQVEAAAGMAPEDRAAMIRGMVEGLAGRLATEGGPAEDWAQLIRALGALGERDRAAAIWAEAQGRFADRPAALALVRAAAEGAGVAE